MKELETRESEKFNLIFHILFTIIINISRKLSNCKNFTNNISIEEIAEIT